MPAPNADGPDIARRYQDIVGPPPASWSLFSAKACEGQRTEHPLWRETWAWMHDHPFRYRGLYHWVRSDSTPKSQADFALRLMGEVEFGAPGDLWQTDWETTHGIELMTSEQVAEYNDRIRQSLGEDRVITYSSDWLPDSTLDADSRGEFDEWRSEHPDDALWFANYNTGNGPNGGWAEIERYDATVWQWTSTCPNDSCIRSKNSPGFDMNHIRDRDRLDQIAGLRHEPESSPADGPRDLSEPAAQVRLVRVGDDHGTITTAVFAIQGLFVRWVVDPTELADLTTSGLAADNGEIAVDGGLLGRLHLLTLVGPGPVYGHDDPTPEHLRVRPEMFHTHLP